MTDVTRSGFRSDPLKPVSATGDSAAMAQGAPGLPSAFVWRDEMLTIASVIRSWRETGPCKHGSAEVYARKHSSSIILSSIVAAELYAGVRGNEELDTLDDLISLFRVIPVSPSIARAGGLHKRDYSKAHGVGFADAIVAATAESENAELKTLNIKHYPMIKGLRPAYTKTP